MKYFCEVTTAIGYYNTFYFSGFWELVVVTSSLGVIKLIHWDDLFFFYFRSIVLIWKLMSIQGYLHPASTCMHWSDDQVILQKMETPENALQQSIYHLNRICGTYSFKVTQSKTQFVAFKGKFPIRSKIDVWDKICLLYTSRCV